VTIGPAPSGENTKRRQMEYDALGRLTSVCEITGASGSGTCGQNSPQTGFWTKYTYDALGNLLTVTQNAQPGGSAQTRAYQYDAMSRLTSETNAETGTSNYTYDTDSTCSPSSGDLVKRTDAVGNTICYAYDAIHRVTSKTSSGPYAPNTPNKYFVYDAATVNGTAMANAKTRLAEAYTATSQTGTKITDLGFSYTARGETSDVYQSTPNSGGYFHVNQTYWPNGAPSQLSQLTGLPTISYGGTIGSTVGLDGEGRVTQVTAGSGQNPVTGVTYNTSSLATQVNFGSGDSDIFAYDSNTLRMTQFKFNVGATPQSYVGTLTWNANSTLNQLAITDPFNSADTQTCNYAHDDLTRIASANCGSAAAQTFSYDPFGNLSKSGSPYSFLPIYSTSTNHMTSLGSFTPTYDNNGNLLNDGVHSYAWDASGHSTTLDGVSMTYDALDRLVEATWTNGYISQRVYAPTGAMLGYMQGQSLVLAFIPLPGTATAVYYSGNAVHHYEHKDWLGSARITSSASQTFIASLAYAPFGDTYAVSSNLADGSFTGQFNGTVHGIYDFLYREYPLQGRWPSPDPAGLAAVDPANPQSWNRYAYVTNNPLNLIDPFGLDSCDNSTADTCVSVTADPLGPSGGSGGGIGGGSGVSKPCLVQSIPDRYSELLVAGFGLPEDDEYMAAMSPPTQCGGGGGGAGAGGNNSGNSSPSPTWAAIKTFFTPPSTGPGSCLAVFSNSVQGSAGSAARSLAMNAQKYGAALASGLAGSGVTAAQAEEVVGAMVAGGQLSPAVGAVATNVISGTAPLAAAAAPYVVRAGGTLAVGLFDVALLKGVADELRAALKGQCKP
jgi:RHS repeat-associated protein